MEEIKIRVADPEYLGECKIYRDGFKIKTKAKNLGVMIKKVFDLS